MDISLLTAIIVAVIASITNIICVLYSYRKLNNIEDKKHMDEITKYRYSKLYDLLLNWKNYDSKWEGKTADDIASSRLMNLFFDDQKRYDIAKPLLNQSYIAALEELKQECDLVLEQLIENESEEGEHTKEFPVIMADYRIKILAFSDALNQTIYNQVVQLLHNKV